MPLNLTPGAGEIAPPRPDTYRDLLGDILDYSDARRAQIGVDYPTELRALHDHIERLLADPRTPPARFHEVLAVLVAYRRQHPGPMTPEAQEQMRRAEALLEADRQEAPHA